MDPYRYFSVKEEVWDRIDVLCIVNEYEGLCVRGRHASADGCMGLLVPRFVRLDPLSSDAKPIGGLPTLYPRYYFDKDVTVGVVRSPVARVDEAHGENTLGTVLIDLAIDADLKNDKQTIISSMRTVCDPSASNRIRKTRGWAIKTTLMFADLCARVGAIAEASPILQSVNKTFPGNPNINVRIAKVYRKMQNPDLAVLYAVRALATGMRLGPSFLVRDLQSSTVQTPCYVYQALGEIGPSLPGTDMGEFVFRVSGIGCMCAWLASMCPHLTDTDRATNIRAIGAYSRSVPQHQPHDGTTTSWEYVSEWVPMLTLQESNATIPHLIEPYGLRFSTDILRVVFDAGFPRHLKQGWIWQITKSSTATRIGMITIEGKHYHFIATDDDRNIVSVTEIPYVICMPEGVAMTQARIAIGDEESLRAGMVLSDDASEGDNQSVTVTVDLLSLRWKPISSSLLSDTIFSATTKLLSAGREEPLSLTPHDDETTTL